MLRGICKAWITIDCGGNTARLIGCLRRIDCIPIRCDGALEEGRWPRQRRGWDFRLAPEPTVLIQLCPHRCGRVLVCGRTRANEPHVVEVRPAKRRHKEV